MKSNHLVGEMVRSSRELLGSLWKTLVQQGYRIGASKNCLRWQGDDGLLVRIKMGHEGRITVEKEEGDRKITCSPGLSFNPTRSQWESATAATAGSCLETSFKLMSGLHLCDPAEPDHEVPPFRECHDERGEWPGKDSFCLERTAF